MDPTRNKSDRPGSPVRLVDTHTHHRPFSHDAVQALPALVQSAAESGLAGVMLSDHYDAGIKYQGGPEEVFDIEAARCEWQEQALVKGDDLGIKVLFGIEVGYQPQLASLCSEVAAQGRFDGVILSIHNIDGEDPFFSTKLYAPGKVAAYAGYLDLLAEAVSRVPGAAIAGHYDYVARYGPFADPEMHYLEMPDAFDRLFQALIENGKCLEINVGSLIRRPRKLNDPEAERHALDRFPPDPLQLDPRFHFSHERIPAGEASRRLPDPAIIRRYLELGGRMVSLGSDAHKAGESGRWFGPMAAYLAACGVSGLTHFEKGRPVVTPIG